MSDFLFRGSLADVDADVDALNAIESERQYRRLILIPSESTSPASVREALDSPFHNIYAEGYPSNESRWMEEGEILDHAARLADYRRYSDPRYYKGTEYANTVEALARRRCAETFAANGVTADDIYVNVQALSGGPANNAVYHALVQPGDTVMGMDLFFGGHLSHGSPVNRSGKYYNIVSYSVDPHTEQLDYEVIAELAAEHKPKMIIAGFSSYPWKADWAKFREIADSVGAYLLTDIAHVAGLVAGGAYPSPVGHAHVITSTTHKTLCGPRGAIIMTTDPVLARKIDRAVFPGEQGGPHVNVFAALSVAFKLAQTDQFKQLQVQIIKNSEAMTKRLEERGVRVPFGGTNTHLSNIDCKVVEGPDGTKLSGDMAARILDLAGIVCNRNTIPGDRSALNPTGVRMGTPWITQRGFKEKESEALADIIADLLFAITPYRMKSVSRKSQRAKVDFKVLEDCRVRVRELATNAGIDFEPIEHGYPHFFYIDDEAKADGDMAALDISEDKVRQFLNFTVSSDVEILSPGEAQATSLSTPEGKVDGALACVDYNQYRLSIPTDKFGLAAAWLRNLSDGFVPLDDDLLKKSPGPVIVSEAKEDADKAEGDAVAADKPYYIGIEEGKGETLPAFEWTEPEEGELKQTALNQTHRDLGAKMVPFAGWDMPVWYSSVIEEHTAVREAAGLFDVTHMGVYLAEGPEALTFLDSVVGQDVSSLDVGESNYAHFLDTQANVIDDLFIYRYEDEKYLVVVNASNDDKDWAWLNAVKNGEVRVDETRPWAKAFGRNVTLTNLRDPKAGDNMRVDVALQGPRSRDTLLALKMDDGTRKRILKMKRNNVIEAEIGGFDLILARTGYTGEKMAFEIFVHPDKSVALWNALLKAGEEYGLKPTGLAARDSLRTEAGLPLYGQEMGGDVNLGVADAGFRTYIKTYKPWFIGRDVFLEKEAERKSQVVRFRFPEKGVRIAHIWETQW